MKLTKYIYLFLTFYFCVPILAHNPSGLEFIENKGQWEKNILFKADIGGGAMFLEKDKLTFSIHETRKTHVKNPDPIDKIYKAHAFNMTFLNINPNVKIKSSGIFSNYYNYFIGNDSSKWRGDCKAFSEIHYLNIYPNIDLKITSFQGRPKYSFFLKKGAKINDIKIAYNGLESIEKDTLGNIVSKTSLGNSTDLKPLSYIISKENRLSIPSQFKLENNQVSFEVDNYELKENEVLEIDPEIIFSTYSGSTADNFGATATYDFFGNLYGSGLIFGTGYPTTLGAFQNTFAGQSDIAITKFNSTGSARIYSTYIGGNNFDVPHSLVVDQNSRLILLGSTSSSNYPVTSNAFDNTFNGGASLTGIPLLNGLGIAYPNGADIVITKFNASGGALIGSTYFGGSGTDGVGTSTALVVNYGDCLRGEILVDSNDNVYIATISSSPNLPNVTNSLFKTNSGGFDGIIAKFNTNLSNLISFSYLGGAGDDAIYDMAFDNNYNIVATGGTNSLNFPTTPGAFATTKMGGVDGIITSFDNNLSFLRFSGYYGTTTYDQIYFVELNNNDEIHVFGQTDINSGSFYTSNALYGQANSGQFISIFNPSFTTRIRSTMFGDNDNIPDISPTAFLVDYCDKIFITGWGSNLGSFNTYLLSVSGLPITANAYQSSSLGNGFYMMILEGDLSQIYYGSFFGGTTSVSEEHVDGGTSRFDKNGIVYHAVCAGCGGQNNYPIYPSASAVVAGTNPSPNCNLGVLKFDFGLPVKANFSSSTNCAPGSIQFTDLSHLVGTNVTYQWDFGNGNTSTFKNPSAFYTTPGIYNVRLIVTDPLSCNITDTIIKPVLVLGYSSTNLPDKTVCLGNSVRIGFPGVTDPTITINWTPSNTLDDPSILSPYATPTVTTTYKAIVVKGSCIDTFFQKVIVEAPQNLTISGPNPVCIGTENLYTVNKFDSGTYVWTPSNLVTYSNRDTAKFFIQNATTLLVTYTSKAGCITIKSLPITTINAIVKLTGDSIACKNETLTYNATSNVSGGNFAFSPTNIIVSTNANSANIKIDTSRFVYVDYTNGSCFSRDSFKISLLNDALNWNVDSIICKNTSVIATADKSPAYSITWAPSSILLNGQGNSPATFNLNNISQKIFIEASHNTRNSCKFKDSALIKFLEDELKLTADDTRCKDSGVVITATKLTNVSYLWTPASFLISQNNNIANFRTTNSQYYKVKATDNSGCSFSDSIFITIIDDLVNASATTDSVCKNTSIDLNITQLQGATYQWFPAIDITQGANSTLAKATIKQSQWFFVIVADTNGCFIKDSVFVNIKDSSNYIKALFKNNIVCLGDSLIFINDSRNTTSKTNYFWDFGAGVTTTLKDPKNLFLTSGPHNITLIASDTSKCNKSDTFKNNAFVMANERDTLPTQKICLSDSVFIGIDNLVDSIAKVLWNPGGMTSFYPKVKVSQNTTFIGLMTKNSCTDTFFQSVLVDTIRPIKIFGEKDACLFMNRSFTSTKYDSGQYQWLPENALTKIKRDSATFYLSSSPFQINLNYISEFGCVSKDSIQVNFITPSLDLTGDSIACKEDKLLYKGVFKPKDGILSWEPNSWVISKNDSSAIIKIDTSTNIIGNYFINLRCKISDTIPLQLLKDKVNWMVDSFVCYSTNIIATANTSALWSLNWQPTVNLLSGQNNSPAIFNFNKIDNFVRINATLVSRPTCFFEDSTKVRYIENYLKLMADQTRCKDSGVTIYAPFIANATYNWSPQNMIISQQDSQVTFITDKSRFYYLEVVDNSGCSVKDSIFVTVINDLLKVKADSIICINDTVSINATPMVGAVYTWTPSPLIVNGTGATAIAKLQTGATIYVQVVDTNNCNLRDSVFVNVLDKNTFFIKTTDTLNCRFDSIEIEASYLPNIQYNWLPTSPITSGQSTGKIKGFINANTLFIVTASLDRGCSISDSLFIKKDSNFVKLTANPVVCRLDTFTIKATSNPNYRYTWNPPNWVENRDSIVKYVMLDKFQYRCDITVAPANKCKYFDTITVDYSRLLDDLEATATPARIEYGDSSRLLAKTQNGVDYLWSPKETLDKYLIPSPWAKPKVSTSYEVVVKDRYGCRKSDTAEVEVYYEICDDPEVYVPNAFTPNSDGKNDALYVRGDNIVKLYFAVYDRWGQLIFETNTQKKGWDGTYKGTVLEPSVYAYYLDVLCIGGAQLKKSGNITLLK